MKVTRFSGVAFHACVYRDPVYFPVLAAVVRERLLETARIWSDIRYDESNKDGAAVQCFLGEKFAAPIVEFADGG